MATSYSRRILDLYHYASKALGKEEEISKSVLPTSQRFENLILNLKGREWREMNLADREKLVELGFHYWRKRGFPYPNPSDAEMVREYFQLEAVNVDQVICDGEIRSFMVGMGLANCFHPQMWAVRVKGCQSPFGTFMNDAALRRAIRTALTIWDDRSAINASNLRRTLSSFSRTARVWNFRPTAAKAIYERFSKDGDTVVDFSAGYGGRMLGCLPLDRVYVGIDPCMDQILGLRIMKAKLRTLVKTKACVRIKRFCAEDFLSSLPAKSAALIFSSPPYFDLERYSTEESQSYVKFPVYEQWLTGFLEKVFCESERILKKGGYMAVNIADVNGYPLAEDTLGIAKKYFRVADTLKLRLSHLPYKRENPAKAYKYEPVFIFRKS